METEMQIEAKDLRKGDKIRLAAMWFLIDKVEIANSGKFVTYWLDNGIWNTARVDKIVTVKRSDVIYIRG